MFSFQSSFYEKFHSIEVIFVKDYTPKATTFQFFVL